MKTKILDIVIPDELNIILQLAKHNFQLDDIPNLDINENTILLLQKGKQNFKSKKAENNQYYLG